MRYYILVTFVFLILASSAYAQYDEKAILYQNAQRLYSQRQFVEAEQAWLQVLLNYPNDISAVAQLFQLYLQINNADKAEKLLKDYRTVIPSNQWLEYDIQVDVMQAKLKDAMDKAQAYIQLAPNDEQRYRLLASYFERKGFSEQAVRLYEQGRAALGKTDIFNMEIGNNAFNSHIYDKAITEYIRYLEAQPGNIYFVGNQLKAILKENPDLITLVKRLAKASASIEVKEVYAITLSRMGRPGEALTEYEQLPSEKLYAFANEQYTAGHDSLAIAAFNTLRNKQIDVKTLGEVLLKTTEVYIRLRQFAQAESIISLIVNPVDNKVNSKFERMQFPFQAYLILADLALWQGKEFSSVIAFLDEARKVALNNIDKAEVDYRLIGTYFISKQYEQAEQLLLKQNNPRLLDRKWYFNYLIAMAQGKSESADSLLNELILTAPSSIFVNDIMTMNILLLNLSKSAQSGFLEAFRYKMSHRDSLAIQTVADLAVSSKDEELRILAADWAQTSGFKQWAEQLYNFEWQDELLKDYASLQRSKLQTQTSNAEIMAQDFLKTNPNSVFSPGFRQILQKAPTGRPNL